MSGHEFIAAFDDASGIDTHDEQTSIGETTIAEMREIMARYPDQRSALLPMLHLVQSVDGRISDAGVKICADLLGISTAQVNGVATFYTMYKRRPAGHHHIGVCTTTVCAVMGGDVLLDQMKDKLGIDEGETTPDGMFSLERLECNAACDFAPVMMVNWEFMDQMTPEKANELIDNLQAGKEVHSTRGAHITSWAEAERVLAGFSDGLADEGPTAAGASLAGLKIAREKGWKSPTPPAPAEPAADDGGESK
ncbi:NADH-quinone oxidoreductase subunit NuoE [Propionimicrobium sp. PCR01-08-3]|uniref:NADH-quinone oxidoreductase subunit NuoE n=1 Tax=Propionimicrobium sp. PCR01-08-3 TaxID=3052086 RepID=UPI00255C43FD|nr:NADH-quinone oxidoreductase subunit NuoE [Propionimicrobium sp. PCR01-08-3]WIY83126.1 NADH-quinone oxidoreductase subunit NuoE [Propionimicrobium sp. PCR01-08-3]